MEWGINRADSATGARIYVRYKEPNRLSNDTKTVESYAQLLRDAATRDAA